jgi:predicted NAD/FAD-dependent oxidoreductase
VFKIDFKDEEGSAVVPTSIKWSLTDASGTEINGRTDVDVAVPAATIYIVLSNADLAITTTATSVTRLLAVEAVYSSTFGSNLTFKEQIKFIVDGIVAVP